MYIYLHVIVHTKIILLYLTCSSLEITQVKRDKSNIVTAEASHVAERLTDM